ncbi:hypothetical protein IRJ41_021862 [Triplophysa rosa]|uniref:Immunoglobulin domain-containing protein n=1 Tax=Triplophysa rosa TaxID=992332 RepID=A0A9W7W8W0_TRIRA|nr:hypothetical protein IRJ41_021862 [Triplophysa rosa]
MALIDIFGVFGVDEVSVKEGESVTLHINPKEIQRADELLWFFNDETTFIAKIDIEVNKSSVPGNEDDERFRNKLKLDHQTGSLTISDVRSTNTGVYHLQISRRSGISDKRFNVTLSVTDQRSHWRITGPVLAVVLLLVLLGVSVIIYKHYRKIITPQCDINPHDTYYTCEPKTSNTTSSLSLNTECYKC